MVFWPKITVLRKDGKDLTEIDALDVSYLHWTFRFSLKDVPLGFSALSPSEKAQNIHEH